MASKTKPIGVFDSGYGGLTVLKSIVDRLPMYDFLYLGDNARAPYGNRSFETVYEYTLECVKWFLDQGCPLIILACNTASAKALRSIQQKDLPPYLPYQNVLGVIRPTAEIIGTYSQSGKVGILATSGTVESQSYPIEIHKFYPDVQVFQQACPLWVNFIENNEHESTGAVYFFQKDINELMAKSDNIDTVLLACTHYPLIMDQIKSILPKYVSVVTQGDIVAKSLQEYLDRHPLIRDSISQGNTRTFYTTDDAADFKAHTKMFYGDEFAPEEIHIPHFC